MKKILLADDDMGVRTIFKLIIEDNFQDYKVQTFSDGNLLEKRLKKDVSDVKLILTDNNMPKITGSKIIEKYAKKPKFKEIPFVLCYGGDKKIGNKAIENGAFSFIEKPVHTEEYVKLVNDALNYSKKFPKINKSL